MINKLLVERLIFMKVRDENELIKRLRKGWSPFPIEVDSLMNEAADQLDVVSRLIRIEKILEKQTQLLSQIHLKS